MPDEVLVWQDPIPEVNHDLVTDADVRKLKADILDTGLSVSELVRVAWASAASFRGTDMRGGANGARVRLAPQNSWAVNNPAELDKVLLELEQVKRDFNRKASGNKRISTADIIVLAGAAAIEKAAKDAGHTITVPFEPGRMDASQEMTDVQSFAVLEPTADAFRNFYDPEMNYMSPTEMLVERADYLNLSVPEMTALLGGMRVLDANYKGMDHGVLTNTPGKLNNAFFTNLLDMGTKWNKTNDEGVYKGVDRASGKAKWTATPVDLIFGSNSELRAIAEVYASADAEKKFVADFVDAWVKVMQNDRFDLK